jgi:hypothetical protein
VQPAVKKTAQRSHNRTKVAAALIPPLVVTSHETVSSAMNNPFGVPPASINTGATSPGAMNMFDPLAPPPADPFGNAQPFQPTPTSASGGANPFMSPASTTTSAYGSPFQPSVAPPAAAPTPPAQPQQQPSSYETALVSSQYQSNPYGGMVLMGGSPTAPAPGNNTYQWGLDAGAAPSAYGGAGSSYNAYPPQQQQQYAQPPPPNYQEQQLQQQQQQMTAYQQPQQTETALTESRPPPANTSSELSSSSSYHQPKPIDEPLESKEIKPTAYEFGQKEVPTEEHRREDEFKNHVNPYRGDLAREAPHGSSPLPKPELVRKKGYVLSRISFRTIVMKKWKQSLWVQ